MNLKLIKDKDTELICTPNTH